MPVPVTPSFIQTPGQISGSPNLVGTILITDSAGNLVKVQKVVLNDSITDTQGTVTLTQVGHGAQVVVAGHSASGMDELSQMRRIQEQILLELRQLNANFLNANPMQTSIGTDETVQTLMQ